MQRSLLLKFLMIGGVLVLIGISLGIINSIIAERSAYRDKAVQSIAEKPKLRPASR
jgi:inner membrane protein involved in colicin E2 resistance